MRPDSIAHYRIDEKLGQGGMGEVYRATDTKLGRAVAVKFLSDSMAGDATHMARFSREAQVLASLNHPNIAAIYGVEDRALIMELVEGPSLSDRIKAGPIPLDEALSIARQIADALEAAHARGIVHRDLKPANIKFAADGTVKVLDFGLAKVAQMVPLSLDESPTIATTHPGFILGTAGYMAPEQARGKDVDRRADIWAFGVVLYEMLTGTQPFQGETVTDVMAAVVRQDPDLSRVPPKVRPVLRRCLDKDPKRRLRDVGDAMLLLDETMGVPSDAAPAGGSRLLRFALGSAAVLLLAFLTLAYVHFRETPAEPATVRFDLDLHSAADLSPIGTNMFAISPDGRRLAFAAFGADGTPRIWLRSMNELTSRVLPGSEIDRNSYALFWSPDSRYLAYWSERLLKRLDVSGGGPPQTIAQAPGNVLGGTWNRDGVILFGTLQGLMQVPAAGGTPTQVTQSAAKSETHFFPQFLPDGRHFLYLRGGLPGNRSVYIGTLDASAEEQNATPLLRGDFAVRYVTAPDGRGWILFVRDDTLLAQSFDPDTLRLDGEAVPIAQQVFSNNQGIGYFSSSDTGVLVYFMVSDPGRQITWYTRQGEPAGTPVERALYGTMKLSPDGTRLIVMRQDERTNDNELWQIDLTSGTTMRFTVNPGLDAQPVWSSDGTRIAWVSRRDGMLGFYSKRADGSGEDELLYRFERADGPSPNLTDWTRDGRFLIYNYNADIWALPIAEGTPERRQPLPVVQTEGSQLGAYVSPDMRWIAYISNESGRQDMFVQPFAPGGRTIDGAPAGGKWVVSNGTMGMARWRSDSRELLFVGTDGGVMAVEVAEGAAFRASPPKLLFQLPRAILTASATPGGIVDVTRDHQRFILSLLSADVGSGYKVVVNWQSELSPQAE